MKPARASGAQGSARCANRTQADQRVLYPRPLDATFTIKNGPVEKNGTPVDPGIGYRTTGRFSSLLEYTGEFRRTLDAHGVVDELRLEF